MSCRSQRCVEATLAKGCLQIVLRTTSEGDDLVLWPGQCIVASFRSQRCVEATIAQGCLQIVLRTTSEAKGCGRSQRCLEATIAKGRV
jgi:hypothetical protein